MKLKTNLKNFFSILRFKKQQVSTKGFFSFFTGGTKINVDSCMQISAYNRGVLYLASQLAKLPWEVKDSKNNVLDRHRVHTLLNIAPNVEMTAFVFASLLVQTAINWGNFYAEIERSLDGRPLALHPIHPMDVTPYRLEDGTLVYRILSPISGSYYISTYDIFHIKNIHLAVDGLSGMSLVDYAFDVLGIAKGSDIFANALFANGGMPSGVLEAPGKLSAEAGERVKKSWQENHGGKKSGGTAILEEGLVYKPISHNPNVMQFLETRKFSVQDIGRFLGVPPTKLFDTEAATFNNVENDNLNVATDTLHAWTANIQGECNVKLLNYSYGGLKVDIDLSEVFRGDSDTRAKYFQAMFGLGSISPDEIRLKEGRAPLPGKEGQSYYIANNNYAPINKVVELIDSQIEKNKQPATQPKDPANTKLAEALIERIKNS